MIIEWLLIVWFAGAENFVVIGDGHKTKLECEQAAKMISVLATHLKKPRPMEQYFCVIREVKQGA